MEDKKQVTEKAPEYYITFQDLPAKETKVNGEWISEYADWENVTSPFYNHTFKDDFLFVKYDGKFDPPEAVITYNDSTYLFDQTGEYIFGNDIVDVVLNIEKYSPDVAEKLQEIKAAMVTQYNAWIDEMGGMFGLDESRKIRTLEELVSG